MELTALYYTANYLETKNPYFLANTRKQLVSALKDLPMVVVSHKPTPKEGFIGYKGDYTNIVAGKDFELHRSGRGHLNIYKQILEGCKVAKTDWVVMTEDDILYSESHFRPELFIKRLKNDTFYYDMAKLSILTWTKPPMFSFRTKRRVVNQLVAPRKVLLEAMEERFKRLEELVQATRITHPEISDPEAGLLKYWGDPGRYENLLGVTVRPCEEYFSWVPSVVFSHEYAYGYEYNQGKKKKLGDVRIIESADWGRAEDILKLYKP